MKKTEEKEEEAWEAFEGRSVGKPREEGRRDREVVTAMKKKKEKKKNKVCIVYKVFDKIGV